MVKFDYKSDIDTIFNSKEPPFKNMVTTVANNILKYVLSYNDKVDQEFVKKEVSEEFVYQLRKFVNFAIRNRKNQIKDLNKFIMMIAISKKSWISDVCKEIISSELKLFDFR